MLTLAGVSALWAACASRRVILVGAEDSHTEFVQGDDESLVAFILRLRDGINGTPLLYHTPQALRVEAPGNEQDQLVVFGGQVGTCEEALVGWRGTEAHS